MTTFRMPRIHSMVNQSIMNTPMAQSFILANADKVNKQLAETNRQISPYSNILHIIDDFMNACPRGKGTKGSELFRKFYAACYTIKLEQSRGPWFKDNGSYPTLSKRQIEALACFSSTGEPVSDRDLKGLGFRENTLMSLVSLGLLTGDDDYWWLTNKGLRIAPRAAMRQKLERQNDMLRELLDYHTKNLSADRDFHERAIKFLEEAIIVK